MSLISNVVFVSYLAEIPWAARVARELRASGLSAELWIFTEQERLLGCASGAFAEVVDLSAGFVRPAEPGSIPRDVLARAKDLEDRLAETFLHREAAADRRLTGFDQIDIPPTGIRRRWAWAEIALLALHLEQVVRVRLEQVRPVAVMLEPGLFAERLISRITVRAGVRLMMPGFLPYLPDRIYFTDRLDAYWPECAALYQRLLVEDIPAEASRIAEATMESIRTAPAQQSRRETIRDFLPSPLQRFGPARIGNVLKGVSEARREGQRGSPHSSYPELVTPSARLRRKLQRYRLRRGFESWSARELPSGAFASYFLHSQPEVTVEGWAFDFQDQVATVRNIVATLPADTVLVVKEHWIQAGLRDPAFYKELLSIPGVVLLHDSIPTRDVIVRSDVVFTLTGTAALEAMCLGVPAVIFGDIYYEDFAGVRRVRSWGDVREVVAALADFPLATDREVVAAFAARYLASHEAGWLSGGRYEADEFATARALLSELGPVQEQEPMDQTARAARP